MRSSCLVKVEVKVEVEVELSTGSAGSVGPV